MVGLPNQFKSRAKIVFPLWPVSYLPSQLKDVTRQLPFQAGTLAFLEEFSPATLQSYPYSDWVPLQRLGNVFSTPASMRAAAHEPLSGRRRASDGLSCKADEKESFYD